MTGLRRVLSIGVIAVSFLLTVNAFAGVPWAKFSYFKNWGGLNDNLSSTEIEDNEATDIQNIVFDTGGTLKKRNGYINIPTPPSKFDTSATTLVCTGISFFKKDNGNRYLVAVGNFNNGSVSVKKKDYDVGGGAETGDWEEIGNGSILPTSSYDDDNLVSFSIAQDNLIFTLYNTSEVKPFKWTGSGIVGRLTDDTDCPNASINIYHKNHLFLSGNGTYPSRVWFSALDDITDYTPTDFFDLETSDGSKVRGFISAYDSLYIFKDSSIWRLSGSERDSFILEKMVDGIGTLSSQSIKLVNNVIYFTTPQNDIAIYDGGYTIKFISQKIRNTIGGLNFQRATNNIGLAFSTYKYNDTDYYCGMSNAGSATNNRILVFDTAYSSWTKFVGIKPNAWVVAEGSDGKNIIVFGDYSGYIYYYPSTTYYDGDVLTSAITSIWQSKWFKYPDLSLGDKYLRLIKTYALSETDGSSLTIECKKDYDNSGRSFTLDLTESGALWDSAVWDVDKFAGQSLIVDRREVEIGKEMFQIKYSNENVSEGFTVFGYELFLEPTERI